MNKIDRRDFVASLGKSIAIAGLANTVSWANEPTKPRFPYVDGLTLGFEIDEKNDGFADLPGSGLSAVVIDVSSGEQIKTTDGSIKFFRSFDACRRSIVEMRQKIRKHPEVAFIGTRGSDARQAFRQGRTAIFFQFQGCEPIGDDLSRIDMFYELGLRILQITHHNNNPFGGGCIEKQWTGLTKLGIEGVERMNALGIIPDLAHVSDPTSLDVIKTSKKPVIVSHGACRAVVNNARCTSDEVIRGVARSGGAMGIFMMSFWLTNDPVPSVDAVIKQVRHIINIGGIDAVAIANDYGLQGQLAAAKVNNDNAEAVKSYLPWWDSVAKDGILGFDRRPTHVVIPELNNLRRMFTIHRSLETAGFKAAEIEKIMGGNWVRVLTDSLG